MNQSTVPSGPTLKVGFPSLSRYLPSSDLTAAGSTASSAKAIPPDTTSIIVAPTNHIARKILSSTFYGRRTGAWSNSARRRGWVSSLRQREHRQCSAERRVVAERSVAADGAEASGRIGQAGRKTDTRPSTDAGQYCDILPAALLIGRDVANNAGRGLEFVEFLAR